MFDRDEPGLRGRSGKAPPGEVRHPRSQRHRGHGREQLAGVDAGPLPSDPAQEGGKHQDGETITSGEGHLPSWRSVPIRRHKRQERITVSNLNPQIRTSQRKNPIRVTSHFKGEHSLIGSVSPFQLCTTRSLAGHGRHDGENTLVGHQETIVGPLTTQAAQEPRLTLSKV